MDGFCRACLSRDDEQTDLLQYSEKNRRLFVYSTGLQVKRNDAFTFQLCKECYINMKFACNFKKTCRNSDKKIKNYSAIKDIGENVDVCSFFKQSDDSLKLRLPLNTGSSTPHNLKDDDNESTCTSIQNFMTDILQEIPDSEAHIIRQVIEEEADILEDSLDSHWLQDDVSMDSEFKMDFSFSPFSTSRSIQNVGDENLSPIKSNSNEGTNKTETPKSILKNIVPNEIENFGNMKTTENHNNIVPNEIENFGNIKTTKNHNNIVPNEIENFGNIKTTENHNNIVPNEIENFGNIKTTENHNNIVPNEIENFGNIKTTENHNNIVPNEIENFGNIKTTENHNNIVPNEIENFGNIKTTKNHNNIVPNEIENFGNIKTTENHNNIVPNEIENFGNIKTTENHNNIVPNEIENFGNIKTTENHNNIVPNEIENFGNIKTTENHNNIVPNEIENFGNIKTTENHNNIVPNEIENFGNIKTTENHNNIVPNEIENFGNIKTTENHNNIVPNEIENFGNIKTTENHNNIVPNEIENFGNIKTTENHNNIVPNEIENFGNIKTTENHNNIVPNEIENFGNIKTTENHNNLISNEIENNDSLDKIINNKSRENECAIDINLENALKNDMSQKIMLDDLLASPPVLPNITSPSTPLIKKILFGELKDESSQSKETAKEFDEIKENMEVLEEFLNTNVLNEDDTNIYDDIDKIEKYLPEPEIKSKVLENMSPVKNNYCITNFYCKMCDRKFKNLVALKIHCTRYHKLRIPKQRSVLNKFICDYCGKYFNSSRCIIKHIENHKNPVKFECKRCSLKFNTKIALRQHQTTHNHKAMIDNVTKNHVCSICGWACTSNSNYNIHIKRHFKIYMHSCKECGQGFYRKCDLDAHSRKHTGERPYQCDFCSKSFARHDALTRHVKRHTDERPFPCNFCKAAFTNAYDLKHHKENAKSCLKIQIELAKKSDITDNFVLKENVQ